MRILLFLLAFMLAGCAAEPDDPGDGGDTIADDGDSGQPGDLPADDPSSDDMGLADEGALLISYREPVGFDEITIKDGDWFLVVSDVDDMAFLFAQFESGASLGIIQADVGGDRMVLQDAQVQSLHVDVVDDDVQAIVVLA